ncbi:MAG: gfo/Idh/MocA family oxidoreductase, partial [Verrucomicrobia bacterium]|nr:gfo/Idh/MocA family oxidoreductase [Verrucomicrobiota bacterium]
MKNIGVIGCGSRVRGLLKHILGLGEGINVAALCDVSERSIQKALAGIAPGCRVCKDYQELVRDPAIDWVFVGSWNCYHREHAIAALKAGKNVFCEKPLATNLEDCLAIRDAWRASGKSFSFGLVLRYSLHYQKILELIRGGTIGRLVSMEFNETLSYEHGGYIHGDWRRKKQWAGTHLLEKCCHDLDLVNWIVDSVPVRAASFGGLDFFRPENEFYIDKLGPHPNGAKAFSQWERPEPSNPFTAEKDIIDNQVAIIQYGNGVRATFHTNCLTNLPERRMYFCGTEGTLRANVLTGAIEYRRVGHKDELVRVETGAKGGHGGAD